MQTATNSNKRRFPRWLLGVIIGACVYCLMLGIVMIWASAKPITSESYQAICLRQESPLKYYPNYLRDAIVSPGAWIIGAFYNFRLSYATFENPLHYSPVDFAIRDYGPMILSGIIPSSIGGMLATRRRGWQMLGAILAGVAVTYTVAIPFLNLFILNFSCMILD
jgi:hypothetical protein